MFELLKRLSEVSAPAGYEAPVAEIIKAELDSLGIQHVTTPDGSLIGIMKSERSGAGRLMLQAHMDEVGFMVKSHRKEGHLSLTPLGITDTALLTGRRVVIHGSEPFNGYIGAVPVHLSNGKSVPDYEDIYVDIGASSEGTAKKAVPLGSFGSFRTEFESFGEDLGFVKGKALSSRIPCAVILDAIKKLTERSAHLPYDLYLAFTARGKLSLCSAGAVYRRIGADGVISVVGTDSMDTPSEKNSRLSLGQGIAVPLTEEKYSYDTEITSHLRRTAADSAMQLQNIAPIPKTKDTDYDLLRMKNAGARLGVIRIPVRYKNTPCEAAAKCDITSAALLLTEALMTIDL